LKLFLFILLQYNRQPSHLAQHAYSSAAIIKSPLVAVFASSLLT